MATTTATVGMQWNLMGHFSVHVTCCIQSGFLTIAYYVKAELCSESSRTSWLLIDEGQQTQYGKHCTKWIRIAGPRDLKKGDSLPQRKRTLRLSGLQICVHPSIRLMMVKKPVIVCCLQHSEYPELGREAKLSHRSMFLSWQGLQGRCFK